MAKAVRVVVAGAGPAGIGAAIGAARMGAKVALIERYGFPGGMATAGLVHPWMTYHAGDKQIIGGIFQQVIEPLKQRGAFEPSDNLFDPEQLKQVLLEMLVEAGVELHLHTFVVGVRKAGGAVRGLVVYDKSGRQAITGDLVIDATGDGDVAAFAGCPYEKGRKKDGLMQPMTLHFRMAAVDRSRMPTRQQLNQLYTEAKAAGKIRCPRENVLWFNTTIADVVHFNTTRVVKVDGTNADDLTKAEIESRRQAWEIAGWLQREVPGFERAYISATGPQVGVRETRRIMGHYVLTARDVLSGRKFRDGIALCSYPIDIHNPAGSGTVIKHLKPGDWYSIPYRCLLPLDAEGLLVAGRPISSTHEAHSSLRVQPICYATGHAAGIAAVLAAQARSSLADLDVKALRRQIIAQGGILD
jgi:glycine/D-amino acid oxidase-like deaminating enzyme